MLIDGCEQAKKCKSGTYLIKSKILALVLAALMLIGMTAAFADTETAKGSGDFSVTISNNDENTGHNYVAYQVFTGDLVEKTAATTAGTGANLVLSNIDWGNGVNGPAIVTELAGLASPNPLAALNFTAGMSAEDVAKKLDGVGDDVAIAQAFAEVVQNHLTSTTSGTSSATGVTGLKAGYYFIQDEGDLNDEDHAGAKSRYILQVVHSVSVTQKANVPQVDKYTQDKQDTAGTTSEWKNTSDYDVGDAVPFKIVGTLPSNFAEYDYFKTYTFTDTLSNGLDAPAAADISIHVGETDVKSHFDINISGQTITISLKTGEDLKTWTSPALTSASTFVVEYSAVLNEDAVSGPTGNENEVTLTFSNNPNADGQGENDTTPPSTVIVFTFDLNVDKVDSDGYALDGAHFALYKQYADAYLPATATAVTSVTYDEGRKTYTFEATQGKSWALVEEITTGTTFGFDKVDEGKYVLVETATPAGYNSVAPYAFEVTATIDDEGKTLTAINGVANGETVNLGTLTATVVMDDDEGSLNTSVVNNGGTTLPSTGGIGTTLFYIGGSILVLAAVILLVTKRRMANND